MKQDKNKKVDRVWSNIILRNEIWANESLH